MANESSSEIDQKGIEVLRAKGAVAPRDTRSGTDEAELRHWARHEDRGEALRIISARTERRLERTGQGLDLAGADLSRLDLRGFDLRRAKLHRSSLYDSDLGGADLSGSSLICAGLERTRFVESSLQGAYIHGFAAQVCSFERADLSDLRDGTGALFHGCDLSGARVDGSMLSGTSFYQSTLDGASLTGANLQGCRIVESSCVATSFERATFDLTSIGPANLEGASLAGARGAGLVLQRLTGADRLVLDGAELPGLRVLGVSAEGVSARGLLARRSDWQDCSLSGVVLTASDLTSCSWNNVIATSAQMQSVMLDGARWSGVSFSSADLTGAQAENWTVLDSKGIGAKLRHLRARCLTVRNSDLRRADLGHAYLYRAMITGDPPHVMRLDGSDLEGAILVQAYVTADLTGVHAPAIVGAYARLNQCRFLKADLRGARLFQASLVKSKFHGAKLDALEGPLFADRCPGLPEALERAGSSAQEVREQVQALGALLGRTKRGST